MDFLMLSGMLLQNFLICTSSVIDLWPCLSIYLICMLSSALANWWTPMCLPSLFGVIVSDAFHRRSLWMDGIRKVLRASMDLKKVWSLYCWSCWHWWYRPNALCLTLNATNSKGLLLFKSISLDVKNLYNSFTDPWNLCEFFHLLSSLSSVSGG